MNIAELPKYTDFMLPTLVCIEAMGGSGSVNEINDAVADLMSLPAESLEIFYPSGTALVIPDRISWARSYMKTAGLLSSGGRGVWLITDEGKTASQWSEEKLKTFVAAAAKAELDERRKEKAEAVGTRGFVSTMQLDVPSPDTAPDLNDWQSLTLKVVRQIEPAAFERLCQRLSRESGFVKVEVTGRSGDGGIDGTGILQLSLMSFHVLFQCKRYSGSVGSSAVRDFRGAMMGRTDKGLIITTGSFSPDARREVTRVRTH